MDNEKTLPDLPNEITMEVLEAVGYDIFEVIKTDKKLYNYRFYIVRHNLKKLGYIIPPELTNIQLYNVYKFLFTNFKDELFYQHENTPVLTILRFHSMAIAISIMGKKEIMIDGQQCCSVSIMSFLIKNIQQSDMSSFANTVSIMSSIIAGNYGNREVAEFLIDNIPDSMKSIVISNTIRTAARSGQIEFLKFILDVIPTKNYKAVADMNLNRIQLLKLALENALIYGQIETINFLFVEGAVVDDTTTMMAVSSNNLDVVKMIVIDKLSPVSRDVIFNVMDIDNSEIVKFIVRHNYRIFMQGFVDIPGFMRYLVDKGRMDVITILLNKKILSDMQIVWDHLLGEYTHFMDTDNYGGRDLFRTVYFTFMDLFIISNNKFMVNDLPKEIRIQYTNFKVEQLTSNGPYAALGAAALATPHKSAFKSDTGPYCPIM